MKRSYTPPSARTVDRALARMAAQGAILAPDPHGRGYGVFLNGDRRRRPLVRISAEQAMTLAAEGAVAENGEALVITRAGHARAARAAAAPGEAFQAQHAPIVERAVMDEEGDVKTVRGLAPFGAIARLARLKNADGSPWLTPEERAAARALRADWDAGQVGLVRGADWSAPPKSANARGPGNGREAALAIGLDARARVDASLAALAPPLRRVATALLLHDCGLEEFERAQGWPQRTAKIALKLALAQLAQR